ncbi:MAG: DUF4190 domain-containing protein [Actinomycetota bacterium]
MAAHTCFVSYSRLDGDAAADLVAQLQNFGQEVWRDERLSGGQPWWDSILDQIRSSDLFIFAQSESSIRSKACRAELEYARALGKRILPVEIGPRVPDEVLPRFLAEAQRIPSPGSEGVLYQLGRTLVNLEPSPLPDPLPEPPPVPISYNPYAEMLDKSDLTREEQWDLLTNLKQLLHDDEQADAARALLARLRRRQDVYAMIAAEIDQILDKPKEEIKAGAPDDRHETPAPTPTVGSRNPSPGAVTDARPEPQVPVGMYPPAGAQPGAQAPAGMYAAPAPQPARAAMAHARTNGLAIASLVLSLVWMYGLASIAAIVLGHTARNQVDRSGGAQGGRGLATAGIVLGWIGVGLLVLALIAPYA